MYLRNSNSIKLYDLKQSKQELKQAHEDLQFLKPDSELSEDIRFLVADVKEMHKEIEQFYTKVQPKIQNLKEEIEDVSVDESSFQNLLLDAVSRFAEGPARRLANLTAEIILKNYTQTKNELLRLKEAAIPRNSLFRI